MKSLFKKSVSLFLVLLFAACSNNSPKSVAGNFLSALNKMDFEAAKKYGTEDTGKLLDMMSGFAKMIPDSSKKNETKFSITGEKIDGDKATVTYTEEGKEGEQSIPLMKVNGEWKVAMSKDSMNDSEGENGEAEAADSVSTGENEVTDSLSDNK
jgi:hypothetical protein